MIVLNLLKIKLNLTILKNILYIYLVSIAIKML